MVNASALVTCCQSLFSHLLRLGDTVKSHDHQPIHFNIENAVAYVQAQSIQSKFLDGAASLEKAGLKEAEKALKECISNLDSCLGTCARMGTPQWTTNDDAKLTVSWNLFVANFNSAGLLLHLPRLDLHPFLGLRPLSGTGPSLPSLTPRNSILSASSSRAGTIEGWNELRTQQERDRLKALRIGRQGIMMTATGTPLRMRQASRNPSLVSDSASESSAGPSRVQPPSLSDPVPQKGDRNSTMGETVLSSPPPPYIRETPTIRIEAEKELGDRKEDMDWDARTSVSTGSHYQRHQSYLQSHPMRRTASESQIDFSTQAGTHFHFYGSGNTFNILNAAASPICNPWLCPQSPTPSLIPFAPPQPVVAYKPSSSSLRETAALHLWRQGAPKQILQALKPEAACEHGIVHFKEHLYCGWNSCCYIRGCSTPN